MKKPDPHRVRRPTPTSLANAALTYLARYACSEASLRRVLNAKIRRAAQHDPEFAADREAHAALETVIDAIVARHRSSGALNDAVYAEIKVRGLRHRGRSRRMISQELAARGVDGEVVKDALVAFDDDRPPEDADLAAARALARRRKLGPFRNRPIDDDAARRKADQKDVAVLMRAGFPFAIIKQVLAGEDVDGIDDDGWH